jgi:glycolate oxidase FAD binding subunit
MSDALATRLRAIAGTGAVRQRTEGAGRITVAPDSADAVAEVLAWCADEGEAVQPAGACTWLHAGRRPTPAPAAVVLSTSGIRGVAEHEPADLVVGVRAGTALQELEAQLRRHGQTLPLDPPGEAAATIGAAVALNAAGPLQAGHGTPRDMVLGLELVTGDGRLVRFGGRVVKNVAGYDVTRLVIGSRGTLGVITSLYVRVRGAPETDRTVLIAAADRDDAAARALAIRAAVETDALEVLSPGAAGRAWTVAVRLRGSSAAVDEAVTHLHALAADAPEAASAMPADAGPAADAFRAGLAAAEARAVLQLRLMALPAELPVLLAAADRFVAAISGSDSGLTADGPWRAAAHGAAGVARIWLQPDSPLPSEAALRHAGAELATECTTSGWTWRYDVVPDTLQAAAPPDSAPDTAAMTLMEKIRRSFDPAGILLPAAERSA